jgi:MinD superfamily P-loop ATPase
MRQVPIKERVVGVCQSCGLCVMVCPMECFESTPEKDVFKKCCGCGKCLEKCPVPGAIKTKSKN